MSVMMDNKALLEVLGLGEIEGITKVVLTLEVGDFPKLEVSKHVYTDEGIWTGVQTQHKFTITLDD